MALMFVNSWNHHTVPSTFLLICSKILIKWNSTYLFVFETRLFVLHFCSQHVIDNGVPRFAQKICFLTLFRIGFFGAAHRWGVPFWPPLPKICHIYPIMMKLGAVIACLRKTQKKYKSHDTFLEFCWHKHIFTRNQ